MLMNNYMLIINPTMYYISQYERRLACVRAARIPTTKMDLFEEIKYLYWSAI